MAGSIERGVAAGTVEQRATDVGFEVGDGDADGRLAFAQLARSRGERTKGGGLDEGDEGFR